MNKLINKTKVLMKSKGGFTGITEMMGLSLILLIFVSCALNGAGLIHKMTVLDRFADELASKAGEQGCTSSKGVTDRYTELVTSTGLTPTVAYTTSYYDTRTQTVQYGDIITVTLTLKTKADAFGGFSIPLTLHTKSSEQSMQYWK